LRGDTPGILVSTTKVEGSGIAPSRADSPDLLEGDAATGKGALVLPASLGGLDLPALGYTCTRHVPSERAVAHLFLRKQKQNRRRKCAGSHGHESGRRAR
jgi:hypothetical protein